MYKTMEHNGIVAIADGQTLKINGHTIEIGHNIKNINYPSTYHREPERAVRISYNDDADVPQHWWLLNPSANPLDWEFTSDCEDKDFKKEKPPWLVGVRPRKLTILGG